MLRSLYTLEGRATRREYWTVFIAVVLAAILGYAAIELLFGLSIFSAETSEFTVGEALAYFSMSFGISAVMLPITLRRLHDRNKGVGWLIFYTFGNLIFEVVEVSYLPFLNLPTLSQDTIYTIYGIGGIISVMSLIDVGCLRGTEGTNLFGPDPFVGPISDPEVFR